MAKPKALVLTGEGLNCEAEADYAFRKAGFDSRIIHVRDLLSGKEKLNAHCIHFPGGFLHGDDLGSAKALASLIQATRVGGKPFVKHLTEYVSDGGMLFGACNGFQCLAKLGMLPAFDAKYGEQTVTLTYNDSRKYEMRWIRLKALDSACPAFKGIQDIELPVRHGEGRFTVHDEFGKTSPKEAEELLVRLFNSKQVLAQYVADKNQPTQRYPENPNGAMQAIAGICDTTGRVFGMMPHPEGYARFENHPLWHRRRIELQRAGRPVPIEGEGMRVFSNLYDYLLEKVL